MESQTKTPRLGRIALAALSCYWLALVIGTHWPLPPEVLDAGPSDKTLHLTAYFGLALLVCFNWYLRRPFAWPAWLAIAVGLMVYGVIDELTQIPVGRDADVRDWCADCIGVVVGLTVFAAGVTIHRRTGGPEVYSARAPVTKKASERD